MKLVGVPHLEKGDLNGRQIKGVKANGLIMVQADWCGHCTSAKPDFQKLFNSNKDKFFVGTVSNDDKEVVGMLGIQGFPSYFAVKGGVIGSEANVGRDLTSMTKFLASL